MFAATPTRHRGWTATLALTVAALALYVCPPARSAPVTVGSTLPPSGFVAVPSTAATVFNVSLGEAGANLVSPVDGAIVRFRVTGAKGGPYRLRVLRPAGGTSYTAVGSTPPLTFGTIPPETFPAVPIRAGDTIGLDVSPEARVGLATDVPGALSGSWFPLLAEGATAPYGSPDPGSELIFSAEVQPVPTIVSLRPRSGSFRGGTRVTISGTDFADVSAVRFGSLPALRFHVDDEGRLTAVAPPVDNLGTRRVSVKTIAGRTASNSVAAFEFTACVVPRLQGRTLRAAALRLQNAECKLGRVQRASRGAARVVGQGSKPGLRLPPGRG